MSREISRTMNWVDYQIPVDCPCDRNCAAEVLVRVRVHHPDPDSIAPDVEPMPFTLAHEARVSQGQLQSLIEEACMEAVVEYNRAERERELHASDLPRRLTLARFDSIQRSHFGREN